MTINITSPNKLIIFHLHTFHHHYQTSVTPKLTNTITIFIVIIVYFYYSMTLHWTLSYAC